MTRMLISLDESDKAWLENRAQEIGKHMSEVVRQAIRQAQQAEQKPKELLASTKGLWRKGDGLKYQRSIRKEWR